MIFNLLISLLAILIGAIYFHFKKSWRFWRKLNIACVEPKFPAGNLNGMFTMKFHFGEIMQNIYNEMKAKSLAKDYCGIYRFNESALLVISPEFTKTILVKDFNKFIDRGLFYNERDDPMSAHLFFIGGQKWKNLRAKIAPTFTSTKLKIMFHTVLDEGKKLKNFMENHCKLSSEIEIYDLLARFNTDVISSCAFGFESNSLNEPDNEFRTMGKKMLHFSTMKTLRYTFAMTFKQLGQRLGITFNDKDVAEFFMKVVKETIDHRARTGTKRNDFMQLLIELMNSSDENERLSFTEVAAQAFVFYFAGVS